MEGGEKKPLLKGQTAKRLLVMIRSCFCIIVIFISISQRRQIKKPKGNGIKDGLVRRVCAYAVVFWFFLSGRCGGLP